VVNFTFAYDALATKRLDVGDDGSRSAKLRLMNEFVVHRDARILIVDDQEKNVSGLSRFLQKAGYATCISMTDSSRVSERLLQMKPDLILLDLHMEPMPGLAILREVSRIFTPELRPSVLVVTADPDAERKHEALMAGANDFLAKPLDEMELLRKIHHLLESRALARSSASPGSEVEASADQSPADLTLAR
jgi:putative two-component system response regulator